MGNMQDKIITALPAQSLLFGTSKPIHKVVLRMICLTLGCAAIAGVVEFWYLKVSGQATAAEYAALAAAEIIFFGVILVAFGLSRENQALSVSVTNAIRWMAAMMYFVTMVHVAVMVVSAVLFGEVAGRAFHTAFWVLPALIAVILTQPLRSVWRVTFATNGILAVLVVLFATRFQGDASQLVVLVGFMQLLLVVCASTALLYALAALREEHGATKAEVAMMEKTQEELRRSAELAQEARVAAEQMNKSMTAFLNNISHELRTPLNGIIGFSEIIRDEMFGAHASPHYKEYAADIAGSGAHLLGLVNDLLFFSQLNAGRVTITPEPFDICQLLNEIVESYAAQTEEAGLTIKVDEALRAGHFVNLDSVAIRQILRSLISNSIKFSHAGGVISLGYRMMPDDHCEIWVSDTGIGISEKERENVMKLFQQGADSDQNAVPGTGLGLAIVKMLVDMQGGAIDFETGAGCGTTVRIILPVSAASAAAEMPNAVAVG